MFKHNFDFGFEVEKVDEDEDCVNRDEAAMFLDFKDADDLAEEEEMARELDGVEENEDIESLSTKLKSSSLVSFSQESKEDESYQHNQEVEIRPKPFLDTASPDFETNLLSLAHDLQLQKAHEEFIKKDKGQTGQKELHNSLYSFAISASPNLLELVLESIENPEEVAAALQRLRVIIGVSDMDPNLDYEFYYIFSCCTDISTMDNQGDWENIIATSMEYLISEIFMGSIYMTSDHEINVILLPSNLSYSEKELIRSNRIWGIRMKDNLLGDLNRFLQLEQYTDDEGEDLHLELLERFMLSISNRFPNLASYKLGNMLRVESYLQRFNWIREEIDKFLPALLDEESEKEAELLLPFVYSDEPTIQ